MGVPARGWTGEAYQGHVVWDELFIFPFFNYRMPEITRSLLMYRYRRLGAARAAARQAGYAGAMFPWQSGSNGEEVTQAQNLNPRSDRGLPDSSYLQRHVGSAVAYNVWQYFQVTQDLEFYGAELILEIARFWSSIARVNEARGRYEIDGVIGPDEFHEGYPDAPGPGLANNAYTNVMAAWVLWRARDALERLSALRRAELMASLGLTREELARWDNISRRMFVPIQADGVISQFEGYETRRFCSRLASGTHETIAVRGSRGDAGAKSPATGSGQFRAKSPRTININSRSRIESGRRRPACATAWLAAAAGR